LYVVCRALATRTASALNVNSFFVLREIQNVRVRPRELALGLLAERVVPDDPVPQVEADVALGDVRQLRREVVADREIKSCRWA
jgi:hypothetical protein